MKRNKLSNEKFNVFFMKKFKFYYSKNKKIRKRRRRIISITKPNLKRGNNTN
jgi:hypothetical protein